MRKSSESETSPADGSLTFTSWTAVLAVVLGAALPPEQSPLAKLVLAALICLGAVALRSLPGPRLTWPLLILLGWALLTARWSLSLHQTLGATAHLALFILLFSLAALQRPSQRALGWVFAALMAGHGARSLWQRFVSFPRAIAELDPTSVDPVIYARLAGGRAFSSFVLPGHLAAFLAAAAPIVAFMAYRGRGATRLAAALALLLGAGGYVASRSYGGLTALALGVALCAAIAGMRPSRRQLLGALLAVAIAGLGLVAWRDFDVLARGSRNPIAARLGNWERALAIAHRHPITGVGFGAFDLAYTRVIEPDDVPTQHAHSVFLELLAEGGVPALGLALIFLAGVARRARQAIVSAPSEDRLARLAVLAAATTLLVHSAVDTDLAMPSLSLITAALLGWSVAPCPSSELKRWRPLSWGMALGALLVVVAGLQGRLSLETSLAAPDPAEALEWAEQGLRWDPLSASLEARRAELLASQGQLDAALAAIERAEELEPHAAWLHALEARLRMQQGEPIRAYFALAQAQRLYPSGPYTAELQALEQRLTALLDAARAEGGGDAHGSNVP